MKAEEVPMDAFLKLTHFPIVIFYGDYIPKTPTRHPHNDYWRAASEMADLFAAAVNRHGGDAKVIRLPDVGIYGNSHFPFAERNCPSIESLAFREETGRVPPDYVVDCQTLLCSASPIKNARNSRVPGV